VITTDKILEKFGTVDGFEKAHSAFMENKEPNKYIIEY
jgi:hypothetical protein